MTMRMGGCLKTTPWNNNDMGVTPGTAKVQTDITSLIFAWIWQIRCLWACTQSLDAARMIACRNFIKYVGVKEVWSWWGFLVPTAKVKSGYLAPTPRIGRNDTWRWDKGPAESPRGLYGWGSVADRTSRSIVANYASGSCSVAWATWESTKEWIFMDRSPHLAIGYLGMDESWMHVYEGWYMGLTCPWYEELNMHVCEMCMFGAWDTC